MDAKGNRRDQAVLDYFSRYRRNVYSQYGEDGIIEELLRIMGITDGTAVDIGAWDGIKFSNVRRLIEQGWAGVLVEANEEKYKILKENNRQFPRVKCECFAMTPTVASFWGAAMDITLLNIDIDGDESTIWLSIGGSADISVVEWNDRGNKSDAQVDAAADALGCFKVAQTNSNMIFVRDDYRSKIMEAIK